MALRSCTKMNSEITNFKKPFVSIHTLVNDGVNQLVEHLVREIVKILVKVFLRKIKNVDFLCVGMHHKT